jgi:hypothetical protein
MNKIKAALLQLWRGDVTLKRAFWDYAIIYGSLLNLATTLAALGAFAAGWPLALAAVIFLSPLPYNLLAVFGVWRSAERYSGPAIWAHLARIVVVVWAIAATTL